MNRATLGQNLSVITALATTLLAACGGGGGGGGTTTYAVGGTVSGLPADASVTLQNNGGDALTVSANGSFAFPALLPTGRSYNVTLKSRTPGLRCSVNGGSGAINQAAVSNIGISCVSATLSIVHHFAGGSDGEQPMAEMLRDDQGNLYGTTAAGDGGSPQATLTLAPDGTLYGTTSAGGANNKGTIFKID